MLTAGHPPATWQTRAHNSGHGAADVVKNGHWPVLQSSHGQSGLKWHPMVAMDVDSIQNVSFTFEVHADNVNALQNPESCTVEQVHKQFLHDTYRGSQRTLNGRTATSCVSVCRTNQTASQPLRPRASIHQFRSGHWPLSVKSCQDMY